MCAGSARTTGPPSFRPSGATSPKAAACARKSSAAHEEAQFSALALERLRIAHDLHDTLIHSIVNLMARLTLLKRASPQGPLRDDVAAAEAEAREGLRNAREAVGEIRGGFDLPDGAARAIEAAAEQLRTRTGMRVALALGRDRGNNQKRLAPEPGARSGTF
jgi:signal transduction histidine kinase